MPAVLRLCTDRLREFIRDTDQNLKYLGLMGLWSLMRSHPKVVAEHRELVLKCLVDDDITIRMVRCSCSRGGARRCAGVWWWRVPRVCTPDGDAPEFCVCMCVC